MHPNFFVTLGIVTLLLTLSVHPASAFEDRPAERPASVQREPVPVQDFGDNDPDIFVAIGDSITVGFPFVTWDESYPSRLQALLGRTVVNGGTGGARTHDGLEVINYFLRRFKPGYILIMYGANDVMERPAHDIVNNLLTMAWIAKENKTFPIMATVTPVDGPKIARMSHILHLNEVIKSRAAEFDYPVADVATAFGLEGQYLLPDGLHPNSEGMEVIAQTFYQKILEIENQHHDDGGGGGCSVVATGRLSGDWLIVVAALTTFFLIGRRHRWTPTA